MDEYVIILQSALNEGQALEVGLAKLRASGATPVQAIKAICAVQRIGLAEAKQVFCSSPEWGSEVAAGIALHDEIIFPLSKEPTL